ncbi:MAG: class I SAM-dependent methyltransferase [Elusimicrobiales bacterium]|nr:class I SAM-dependent methyltransferase [Elusimicrobiales bacterium]
MKKTRDEISRIRARGMPISPYLEIGAERCQRSLVMENDLGAEGLAADLSFDMLKSCGHYMSVFGKSKSPLRVCCDANALPFLSGSIPFVFCYQTLHHFPDPGPIVAEMNRVLSPGGYFSVNEEPFMKVLHFGLYKGRKIYAQNAPPPGKLRDTLDFFFSESDCNEVAHGVIENDRITLGTWRRALAVFAEKDFKLRTIKGIEADLFGAGGLWRLAAAWLFGGEIRGVGRKAGVPPAVPRLPAESLACPACAERGKESPVRLDVSGASCAVCGSRFPSEDGVLFLFARDKFVELYPEMFLKADLKA